MIIIGKEELFVLFVFVFVLEYCPLKKLFVLFESDWGIWFCNVWVDSIGHREGPFERSCFVKMKCFGRF